MLAIIGGVRSSCVAPGSHVLERLDVSKSVGANVEVVDFGNREVVEVFLKSLPSPLFQDIAATKTLIAEHAYFALDGRSALSTYNCRVTAFILRYRQYGFANVILLTRKVAWIRKRVRDVTDVKFDFSA